MKEKEKVRTLNLIITAIGMDDKDSGEQPMINALYKFAQEMADGNINDQSCQPWHSDNGWIMEWQITYPRTYLGVLDGEIKSEDLDWGN